MSKLLSEEQWYDLADATAQKMLAVVEPGKKPCDLPDGARIALEDAAECVVEMWHGMPPLMAEGQELIANIRTTAFRDRSGKGKAHRLGMWTESDRGHVKPNGGVCGAHFYQFERLPVADVPVEDRCKVCWPRPTTPQPARTPRPAAQTAEKER